MPVQDPITKVSVWASPVELLMKIVDLLLQTQSKISIMSQLTSSDAHREALMEVLNHAYVDHDVTLGQFGSIVGNVTACNNLNLSDEDLPIEGKNHKLALHISVMCKTDSLSNVLIVTSSSLLSRFWGIKSLIRLEPFNL